MSEPAAAAAPPFGPWERMLAARYLRAKRSQGGVALISVISFEIGRASCRERV